MLPSVIEDLRKEPPLPPRERAAAIQLMDQLLREQLLQVIDPFFEIICSNSREFASAT